MDAGKGFRFVLYMLFLSADNKSEYFS